jgi:hypothetical protein
VRDAHVLRCVIALFSCLSTRLAIPLPARHWCCKSSPLYLLNATAPHATLPFLLHCQAP